MTQETNDVVTQELIERLTDEAMRLACRSIEHGCVDSGLAANLAVEAIDALQSQSARIAELEELARKSLRWFEDNGCAGSLQIELRNALTNDSTSG